MSKQSTVHAERLIKRINHLLVRYHELNPELTLNTLRVMVAYL
jgi:hypothetical protein